MRQVEKLGNLRQHHIEVSWRQNIRIEYFELQFELNFLPREKLYMVIATILHEKVKE